MEEVYKLINKATGEEHLCKKLTIGDYDYYVNDEPQADDYCLNIKTNEFFRVPDNSYVEGLNKNKEDKRLIATTNPNIDAPKVIDELKTLCEIWSNDRVANGDIKTVALYENGFIDGYNKHAETHPYSEEDMIDLIQSLKDYTHESHTILGHDERSAKELFDIWKEQQVKILYYE